MLEVEIGVDTTRYTLREGESITFRHEDEIIELTPDKPIAERSSVK